MMSPATALRGVFLVLTFVPSIAAAKPSKGRLFGLQLSDPEAPEVPIVSQYVPALTDVEPLTTPNQRKINSHRKNAKEAQKRKDETVNAAIRDIPSDWIPLLERPSEILAKPISGEVVAECPKGFELTEAKRCILTVYRDPVVRTMSYMIFTVVSC